MHTQRLKTFQPQPQEPSGGGAIWRQGRGRLLLPSLQALRRLLHKQRRAGGAALRVRWEGKGGDRQVWDRTSLPIRARGIIRHHENPLLLFPSPRFKELRLGWGGNGTKTRGAPFRCPQNERTWLLFFFFFFESTWATHRAPSAVCAAKRTEAAEAELHAGRRDRWA